MGQVAGRCEDSKRAFAFRKIRKLLQQMHNCLFHKPHSVNMSFKNIPEVTEEFSKVLIKCSRPTDL